MQRLLLLSVCWLSLQSHMVMAEQLLLSVPDMGYPPYVVNDAQGTHGLLIEPMVKAADRVGIQLEFTLLPELRSRRMLEQGKVDGRIESPSWTDSPERFLWSSLMLPMQDVLVYHRDYAPAAETDAALAGFEIVTHLGYAYPQLQGWFDKRHAIRVDKTSEVKMLQTLLDMLPERRQRAVVMERGVAEWLISHEPSLKGQPLVLGQRVFGCAMMGFQMANTPRTEAMVQRLNNELGSYPDLCQ